MTTTHSADPAMTFIHALTATRDLEAPYGALAFVMLAAALGPPELRPSTRLVEGTLVVDGLLGTATHTSRKVPAPAAVTTLLGAPGPLLDTLGFGAAAVPGIGARLHRQMLAHDGLAGLGSPESLAPTAVHGLLAAARSARQRSAVLCYAGLLPRRPTGPGAHAGTRDDLMAVAALVDTLARRAGFEVPKSTDRHRV